MIMIKIQEKAGGTSLNTGFAAYYVRPNASHFAYSQTVIRHKAKGFKS